MSNITSLNIKIDRDLKAEADVLFKRMGMNLSTAVNVFVRQAVSEQAMPFRICLDDGKKFHNLLDDMRTKAAGHGFMTDDEINAEIQAARAEIKKLQAD